MVALVQAASTLPVFVLGLPSGALADIVDRRRYFAFTQLWVALIAVILGVLAFVDGLTAPGLLALTFANGIGMAMRWPVFAAIVPDIVTRAQLPACACAERHRDEHVARDRPGGRRRAARRGRQRICLPAQRAAFDHRLRADPALALAAQAERAAGRALSRRDARRTAACAAVAAHARGARAHLPVLSADHRADRAAAADRARSRRSARAPSRCCSRRWAPAR